MVKNKANRFCYSVENGYVTGFFNVYQAINGCVYLTMGHSTTKLSTDQIEELGIDVYSLKDFDHDAFVRAYASEKAVNRYGEVSDSYPTDPTPARIA